MCLVAVWCNSSDLGGLQKEQTKRNINDLETNLKKTFFTKHNLDLRTVCKGFFSQKIKYLKRS